MKGRAIYLLLAIVLASCSKESSVPDPTVELKQKAQVLLRITNLTKSTGSEHISQSDDNYINNLAIFVFNTDVNKTIETYKYVKIANQSDLNNITFQTTTGTKNVYVVANSHDSTQWVGIVKEDQFLIKESNLKKEELKNFAMSGNLTNTTISVSNSINLNLKRVVAKVVLNSIKTDFLGTPYQGMVLSNVKVYLTNAHMIRPYIEGNGTSNPIIINPLQLISSTYSDCKISGIVFDQISGTISDTPYTVKHHFYTYENSISSESGSEKFTRLIVEATLNGINYFYPININREDFGGTTNNGIKRNTVYNITIVIKRPGSSSPEILVEKGSVITSVTIADWDTETIGNIEF